MTTKIGVEELSLGMFVCGLDRNWLETPFLRHRFLLSSEEELATLRRLCRHVYIDESRGGGAGESVDEAATPVPAAAVERLPAAARPVVRTPKAAVRTSLSHEMKTARAVHAGANSILDDVLEDVRLGRSLDTGNTRQVVRELTASIIRNPDALLYLAQLKSKDKYTSRHSVNVCIFTLAFGRHVGIPREQLYELGIGALLHDVGKMRVSDRILHKPGPLTAEELTEMRRHVDYSREILSGCEGIGPRAIEIAYSHHERADGTGYPLGRKSREVGLFTRMVAIVDVYDAITSNRVYHDAMPPLQALQSLYQWRYKEFDNRLVEKFIQCLGVYPTGSVVQMSTGDVGIVLEIHQERRTRPVVKLLLDRDKRPLPMGRVVDLTREERDARGRPLDIAKVLDPSQLGATLGENWLEQMATGI